MTDQAIIWGSSGHGKVLLDILSRNGINLAASVDRNESAQPLTKKAPLLIGKQEFENWLRNRNPENYSGYVAIGGANGKDRVDILDLFRSQGIETPNLMHPHSCQAKSASIGIGNQFLAYSNVAADCKIGVGCILNHRASIDHECEIGDGVHFAPGAILCGLVKVENFAFIGAGAVILPRIRIGENSVIGAGSVVTRDVPAGTTVYGNPAIRKSPYQ